MHVTKEQLKASLLAVEHAHKHSTVEDIEVFINGGWQYMRGRSFNLLRWPYRVRPTPLVKWCVVDSKNTIRNQNESEDDARVCLGWFDDAAGFRVVKLVEEVGDD